MQKNIFFLTILALFLSSVGFAFAQHTPTVSPSPESTPVQKKKSKKHQDQTVDTISSPTPSPTIEAKPQWVPPPSTETYFDPQSGRLVEKMATKVSINTYYLTDATGNNLVSLIDADFKRKFDEYPVGAEGIVRFGKNFDNSYSADLIQVRIAKLSLSEPYLTVTAGRFDLGQEISPTQFFGNYLTMGLRRVDAFGFTLPIRFKVGLQSMKEFETPPTAISVFYIPSLLSSTTASYDSSQSLLIEQLRINSKIEGIPFTLRLNAAQSPSLYFVDSTMNQGFSYSGTLEFTPTKIIDVYGEFGVQNAALFDQTAALTAGIRGKEIYTFGPLSFDVAEIEAQLPVGSKTIDNPFVGGNAFNELAATTPQISFFGHVRARFEGIFINFYVTNSMGDYTFSRINSSNSALPVGTVLGTSNETPGLGVPLTSRAYGSMGYLADLAVEF